jgi:hypothetical protein
MAEPLTAWEIVELKGTVARLVKALGHTSADVLLAMDLTQERIDYGETDAPEIVRYVDYMLREQRDELAERAQARAAETLRLRESMRMAPSGSRRTGTKPSGHAPPRRWDQERDE